MFLFSYTNMIDVICSSTFIRIHPVHISFIGTEVVIILFQDQWKSLEKSPGLRQLHNFYSACQFDGLVQDCSISITNTLEILKSSTKPSK